MLITKGNRNIYPKKKERDIKLKTPYSVQAKNPRNINITCQNERFDVYLTQKNCTT